MSKRPETPDDLPSWDRYETLATFVLTNDAIQVGLLPAIDAVIRSYWNTPGGHLIHVATSYGGALEVTRPRPDDVLRAQLEQAQAKWDEEHAPLTVPAELAQSLAMADEVHQMSDDQLRSIEQAPNDFPVPEPIDRHDTATMPVTGELPAEAYPEWHNTDDLSHSDPR